MCCTENITAAVLQEATQMTITPELATRESTHISAYISTEKEETQRDEMPKESAEVDAEGEANQGKGEHSEDKETPEKDSVAEESLRMTSWVEVENGSAETPGKEAVGTARDAAEEGALWEAEKEQTRSVEEELAMMEEKWREQCAINETLKQRLADEEERFKVRHTQTQEWPEIWRISAAVECTQALTVSYCPHCTHSNPPS